MCPQAREGPVRDQPHHSRGIEGFQILRGESSHSLRATLRFNFLWQNEKRKDKELTERIAKILKHRDEVVKGVDLRTCPGRTTFNHSAIYPLYESSQTA